MKRLFILLLSISLLQSTAYALPMGKRVEMTKLAILSFYKSYLSESMDVRQCDSLARSFLTPEMYVRLNRMNRLADADQLTRSQDTTPTALETLSCRHIKGDWYEVSWRFSPKDSLTHIPLQIKYVKSKPYICYLIPEWGGKEVKEELLDAQWGSRRHFELFLSKLRKVDQISIQAFCDTIIAPNMDYVSFSPYLSGLQPEPCAPESYIWQSGGYMRKGNVVCVFLQAHLSSYQDEYSKWFMERLQTQYFVAVFTKGGKLLRSQCIGKRDGMHRFSIDSANGTSFYVSQFILDDPSMVHDIKGADYTVQRCKVTIGFEGEIEMRQIAEYKQHIPDDELKQNPPLSFGDFLSKFRKWDKKEFGDSLFVCSQEANSSLSSSLLLELFSKNIICERCWPKDLCWTPCHYIETEHSFLCFMVIDCSFPKGQELAYSDYVIALFDKKGQFQKIANVMHMNHDDVDKKIDVDVLNKICTNLTQ